jgi:hypothetical protein
MDNKGYLFKGTVPLDFRPLTPVSTTQAELVAKFAACVIDTGQICRRCL